MVALLSLPFSIVCSSCQRPREEVPRRSRECLAKITIKKMKRFRKNRPVAMPCDLAVSWDPPFVDWTLDLPQVTIVQAIEEVKDAITL